MSNTKSRFQGFAGAAVALAALLFALCITAVPAHADVVEVLDENGDVLQVSDDITRVHVDKLEAGTHEWVKGAKMQIIEAESGDMVAEWATGESTFELEKSLDVNKEYILREVKAPDGYAKVDDVRFVVNAEEGAGITITEPDVSNAEWVELSGTYQIELYDSKATEEVEYKDRPGSSSKGGGGSTAKTGDAIGFGIVAGFVVVVIASGVAVAVSRRRMG